MNQPLIRILISLLTWHRECTTPSPSVRFNCITRSSPPHIQTPINTLTPKLNQLISKTSLRQIIIIKTEEEFSSIFFLIKFRLRSLQFSHNYSLMSPLQNFVLWLAWTAENKKDIIWKSNKRKELSKHKVYLLLYYCMDWRARLDGNYIRLVKNYEELLDPISKVTRIEDWGLLDTFCTDQGNPTPYIIMISKAQ